MQFLVEHPTTDDDRFALCDTRSDAQLIAEDVAGADLQLVKLGVATEGEIRGDWGVLRYAPASGHARAPARGRVRMRE